MNLKVNDQFYQQFVLSDQTYTGFINLFEDRNPLHTDDQFAIAKGFERKVMHGNILNGYLSYFIGECLPLKDVIIHTQNIQFKNPVYLNDVLYFEALVSDVFESVNAVEFKFIFKKQESTTVAKGKIQIGLLL